MRALLMAGHQVTIAGRSVCSHIAELAPPRVIAIDLAKAVDADFDGLLEGVDIVHHFAWSTVPQTANLDPHADLLNNVGPTVRLLEAMRRRGGGRIVFSSSGGTVYGKLQTIPVPETHHLTPITAYGASKLSAETYLNYYHELHGIDTRIVRIANPYGAGQNIGKGQGVIATLVARALRREKIEIWGDGEVVRDFIYISDVVSAILQLAAAERALLRPPFLYNLGAGKGASVNDLVASIEKCVVGKLEIERREGRPFDVPVSVLDISKLRSELNWSPKIELDVGIQRMIRDLTRDPNCQFSCE